MTLSRPATAGSNIARAYATVGTLWPLCAFGNSAVQRRRVLFWHATRIAQGRIGHGLVSAVLIAGLTGNLNSLTSWAVVAEVAVLPPIVMMWRWNPRQTMSERIQEARG
jgi:hypothetical protein